MGKWGNFLDDFEKPKEEYAGGDGQPNAEGEEEDFYAAARVLADDFAGDAVYIKVESFVVVGVICHIQREQRVVKCLVGEVEVDVKALDAVGVVFAHNLAAHLYADVVLKFAETKVQFARVVLGSYAGDVFCAVGADFF